MINKRSFYTKLAPYYDFLVSPTAEQECRFLNDIFQRFGRGKIKSILDLGCGTGRHSCILSKMGYEVTGIDLSHDMLNVARSKCRKVKFIKGNFIKTNFPANLFDASICLWTTIGYILNENDFKTFIEKVYSATKYLLVLHTSNYENPTNGKTEERGTHQLKIPNLTIKNIYVRNFDKNTGIRTETYRYKLYQKRTKIKFIDKNKLRMWRLDEITNMLKPGFKLLKVFGDYSLDNPFMKKKSNRIIIIAQKI